MLTLRHLKSVINHAWHTSWLTLVAITLFGAVCLGLVRAFTPLLATQRTNVEHLASIALQQPIHIDSLKIRWHKFLPVLKLTNVVILDKENKHPLLQAEELDLSLDLIHSLLSGQFQIGPATLRGTHLKLEQHEDGTISLQGMGNLPASNDYNPDELMAWLFSIPQISLENVALSWYASDHTILPVSGIDLVLRNQANHHQLWGQAQLAQTIPTQLAFIIKTEGDWKNKKQFKAKIYLQADNVVLPQWLKNKTFSDFTIKQGLTNFQLWTEWKNNQLQTLQSLFSLNNVKLTKENDVINLAHCSGNVYWQPGWNLDLQLNDLTYARWNKIPGIKNLGIYLHLSPNNGSVDITHAPTQIDFGPLFRAPITLDQLTAHTQWQHDDDHWFVQANSLSAKNQNGSATGQMALLIPDDGSSPIISLLADARLNNTTKIADYLPLTVLKPALVTWLERSITAVQNDAQSHLELSGRLADFPFDQSLGTFLIDSKLNGVNLDYWPKWPGIKNINGRLIFAGRQMTADIYSGQLLNTPLQNIHAIIPLLKKDTDAILHVKGAINGGLDDGIEFLRNSPLEGKWLSAVRKFEAQGPMQLQLQLAIPLEENSKATTEVIGQVNTQDSTLTLPQWEITLQHLQGQLNFTRDGVTAPALVASLWDKPIKIVISDQQTTQLKITYNDLIAQLTPHTQNNGWSMALQSPTMQGKIEIPENKHQPLQANFQHLYLTADDNHDKKWSPTDIPPLQLTSDDFRYGNKKFGRLELQLTPIQNGIKIEKLQTSSPAYQLSLQGSWLNINNRHQTELNGKLTSSDIKTMLTNWALPASLSAKQSVVEFNLAWPAALYDPSFSKLTGRLSLNFKQGQFADIGSNAQMKMNFGRLLNILSLESLAKRLKLDFSDFKSSGFNFDELKGDFNLADGNAVTNNTQLKGAVADVKMAGRIGLTNEDYNLHLKVTPHLTASLPVVAGLAGGPIVGAATWVASKILSPIVGAITSDNYQITGPWSEPKITKTGS